MAELKAGDKAPAFTPTDQNGKKVKLSDYKGKIVGAWYKVSHAKTVPEAMIALGG